MWWLLSCTAPTPAALPDWRALTELDVDNVIVLHVDTLRADHLPWYGYRRDTTWRLAAQRGYLALDAHTAASSWTFPSTSSFLSSQRVAEHGVFQIPELGERSIDGPLWQEAFADAGFRTAFFNGNANLGLATDVDRGWQRYLVDNSSRGNAAALTEPALAWIDESDEPFFLMLQPIDPHRPWQAMPEDQGVWAHNTLFSDVLPEEEIDAILQEILASGDVTRIAALRATLDDLYDEDLLGLDRGLDALMRGLDARGLRERTLVVLTADHGESLLDDGASIGHNGSLRRELIHIPLVFFHPSLPDTHVSGCPTENIDVMPTVAGILGVPGLPGVSGQPFPAYGCRDYGASVLFQEKEQVQISFLTLTRPELSLVHDCGRGRLDAYDLEEDPAGIARLDLEELPEARAWLPMAERERAAVEALWPEVSCPVRLSAR